jgi:ferric-dicitrate binding protein FerR (iron transport regulator)
MHKRILLQYIRNELPEEGALEVYRWITSSETNGKYFAELKNLWEASAIHNKKKEINIDLDKENEEIKRKIQSTKAKKLSLSFILNTLQKIAAILFIPLFLGSVYFLYNYFQDPDSDDYNKLLVPKGQRSSLILHDGTKVWVNSESKLKIAEFEGRRKRIVYLEGEAYFTVAQNNNRPFVVRTTDLNIRVHGTEFNVKAYPEEETIQTTLVKGKVSIVKKNEEKSRKKEAIQLKPKERFTYYKKEQSVSQKVDSDIKNKKEKKKIPEKREVLKKMPETAVISEKVRTDLYTSWKNNRLVFRDESFGKVAKKMERWYNVNIHFENKELKDYRYWGSFDDETVGQALNALRKTTPFQYRLEKRNIYIMEKMEKLKKTTLPME